MKLTATNIHRMKPGTYGDGRGLYLRVGAEARTWICRATVQGRRREVSLGHWPKVTIAQARAAAAAMRAEIMEGGDPVTDSRREGAPTFAEAAEATHAMNLPRWRSPKHQAEWLRGLERHAFGKLGRLPVDRITQGDVLGVLTPIWGTMPETARRVRQRIRAVMRWAMAHGYIDRNPAGEAIEGALPPMPKVSAHFRALPYPEVAAALALVEASGAGITAKGCLRFLVLTAARSGEARLATWQEIDVEAREWRVPAERMKMKREHRVPLSDPALAVLDDMRPLRDASDLVFPSTAKPERPLSDMTLTKLLRDRKLADRAHVHGFRSSFRDWASEQTATPHAVMELSLSHAVGDAVERAYARSDLLGKRRALMDAWGEYVTRPAAAVRRLEARRA